MGCSFAKLLKDEKEIEALIKDTGFQENQLQRLYYRFCHLDQGKKGFLTAEDLLRLPELSANPLGERIVLSMYRETSETEEGNQDSAVAGPFLLEQKKTSLEDIKIPFRGFVRSFARFRTQISLAEGKEESPCSAKKEEKKDGDDDTLMPDSSSATIAVTKPEKAIRRTTSKVDQKPGYRYCSIKGKARFLFRMFDLNEENQIRIAEVFALLKLLFPKLNEDDLVNCSEQIIVEGNHGHEDIVTVETLKFENFCCQADIVALATELYFRFAS